MDECYSTLSVPASPSAVSRWKFLALVSIKRDPLGVQRWRTDTIVRFGFRHEVCSGWHVGEVFMSGPTMSLGYPEATAQLFMTDPFRKEFRMHRTGDFGCVNHEGRLHFIGRRDWKFKLTACRIELAEIIGVPLAYDLGPSRCSAMHAHWEAIPQMFAVILPWAATIHAERVGDACRSIAKPANNDPKIMCIPQLKCL
ncbi:hypothetical protein F5J12DRAFT_461622 [Pisolithus orientalis]|uniref:uncharacterized protein n=1 Tax=Pisolithus orientalis TaxID=936130 RepID=UPI0022249A70|nr:uncharacterized protein F5J12DRAFT_461622 [Pisolithus orientalis]KAI5992002.1 hypothetical protein F5J12DRAFT_461622 [Pisolithus orientalis]